LPFTAEWNGASDTGGVSIQPRAVGGDVQAKSHFGSGILTFNVNALFRTEPGYDLMVTGPLNQPKDGIQPLSGLVETDWAPYTFTMNWKFTRSGQQIAFERDEPFCMIFPVKRGLIEEFEPEFRMMDESKELFEAYKAFAASRNKFNQELRVAGSLAQSQEWQKDYFRGLGRSQTTAAGHQTKVKLREFKGPPE